MLGLELEGPRSLVDTTVGRMIETPEPYVTWSADLEDEDTVDDDNTDVGVVDDEGLVVDADGL